MITSPALLGVDIGTTSCKAVVFDRRGVELGRGQAGYPPPSESGATIEREATDYWEATRSAVRQAVEASTGADIVALAVSSANGFIPIKADGTPVRPAISQLDQRAIAEARTLADELGSADILQRTGNPISPGPSWLPTLRWLQRHEPETLRAAAAFVFPGGLVVQRLTGLAAVDETRAYTTQLVDARTGHWWPDYLDAVGVREDQLPRIRRPTEPTGPLLHESGLDLGLRPGIPVVAGPMDSVAAALAAGVGVAIPDLLVLGTVGRAIAVRSDFVPSHGVLTTRYPLGDAWLRIAVVWGTGSALSWAAHQWTGEPDFERLEHEVEEAGRRPPTVEFIPGRDREDAPPGSREIPGGYLVGPVDATAGEIARAIVDGVAAALAGTVRAVASPSERCAAVMVSGGGARIGVLCHALADALGTDLAVADTRPIEPLGAAMLAGVGVGVFGTVMEAIRAMAMADEHKRLVPFVSRGPGAGGRSGRPLLGAGAVPNCRGGVT